MIVVTGATGKLGRHVVEGLLKKVPADELVLAVRSPEKAADFAKRGVQVRSADYEQPDSLDRAFAGADKLLLISASEVGKRVAQHRTVIDAAKRAGVKLLAYTSILNADRSQMKLAGEHQETERMIRASGLPFVLLRNGWYVENYTENLDPAVKSGAFLGSAGSGRIGAATREDLAEAAVTVLTTPGHENKVYELSGDAAFTLEELAAEVSRQVGKPIGYRDLPPDQYAAALASFGVPEAFAQVLADSDVGIARGELQGGSGELARLIGRPTTSLAGAVSAALRGDA